MIGSDTPLRLTSDPRDKASPVWSPDGRRIAFVRISPEGKTISTVPALGGAEGAVPGVAVTEADLSWSPNGRDLAFVGRGKDTATDRIGLVDIDTHEKREVTNPGQSLGDRGPVFSPDGEAVAFVRIGNLPSSTDIYVAPVKGGPARRLTSDNRMIRGLAWTPDGRSVIFSSNRQCLFRLWRITADGRGKVLPVAAAGYNALNPSVSKTGSLAFTEAFSNINIWSVDSAGGAPAKLLASTRNQHSPQFSPDGAKIAFAADRSGSEEIWISDRDGGNAAALTSFQGPPTGSPRWSPDGKWIAFDLRPEQNADIYAIAKEGGQPRRLTREPSRETQPAWSGDGRWLYFCTDRTGRWEIWKMPAAGGAAVQVTRNGGFDAVESPDAKYLYYTKGRMPGVWRLPLGGGEEEPVPALSGAGKWRYWTVTPKGYYFAALEKGPYPSIELFDFATNRKRDVVTLDKPADLNAPGLAVSPDGRVVLFTQVDQRVRDVMFVERFQ